MENNTEIVQKVHLGGLSDRAMEKKQLAIIKGLEAAGLMYTINRMDHWGTPSWEIRISK